MWINERKAQWQEREFNLLCVVNVFKYKNVLLIEGKDVIYKFYPQIVPQCYHSQCLCFYHLHLNHYFLLQCNKSLDSLHLLFIPFQLFSRKSQWFHLKYNLELLSLAVSFLIVFCYACNKINLLSYDLKGSQELIAEHTWNFISYFTLLISCQSLSSLASPFIFINNT